MTVSVNILGSTTFNAFDIRIRWDITKMNATSVDLTGTILPTPSAIVQCVNGSGLRCGALDGPGVAHVKMFGAANTTAPAAGRLFKIPFGFAANNTSLSVGFQTGCFTTSVPNTTACVLVGYSTPSATITPVAEGIQSQLLGPQLPTPDSPAGNITATVNSGTTSQPNVTFITPFLASLPGTITTWKVQFEGGTSPPPGPPVPAGVRLVVFNKTSATTLTAVATGPVHDPSNTLRSRIAGYPTFLTNQSVIEYFADPGLPILPGQLIGVTYTVSLSAGSLTLPLVTTTPSATRFVLGSVPVGGTVDLSSSFTGFLECGGPSPPCSPSGCPCWSPAVQVFVQVPPPPTDTAGDGIPDFVKLSPEMQALGADPCRKTVAVQMDYMVRPLQDAINTVITSFDAAPVPAVLTCPYVGFPLKPSGVKLIIDVKNQIPFQSWLNFTKSSPMTFDYVKAAFFDPNRARYFHYGIFAHDMAPQSSVSGVAEIFGGNFMVTLGEWPNGGGVNEQAGTILHEIGHNLGLDHGGNSTLNFKSNYLSVMNYAFQVVGVTSQTPSGGTVTRFDFSRQPLPSLLESALDERLGLSNLNNFTSWVCPDGRHFKVGLVSAPLDWNCDGRTDSAKVSVDINNDTKLETLTGYNDWLTLRYKFTESRAFGGGCFVGCDIGCFVGCDIGTELTFPQAQFIEATWTAFLASPHHSTSTTLNCSPASVPLSGASLCTATVTDTNSTTPMTPTGTVSFRSSQAGSFTPADNCSLTGTGASAGCSVTYTVGSGSLGAQTISVAYVGDTNHLGSSGSTTLTGLPPVVLIDSFQLISPTLPTGQSFVPLSTPLTWKVTYVVTDVFSANMTSVVLKDHFAASLVVDTSTISFTAPAGSGALAPVFSTSTGTNPQWSFTWTIGTLQPGQFATLSVQVHTGLDPSGAQQFTTPGLVLLDSGANLKWTPPGQLMQSFTTLPVTVMAGNTLGAIQGIVTSQSTPVQKVEVDLFSGTTLIATATTSAMGFYHFDKIAPGNYLVSVTTSTGTVSVSVGISAGTITTLNLST